MSLSVRVSSSVSVAVIIYFHYLYYCIELYYCPLSVVACIGILVTHGWRAAACLERFAVSKFRVRRDRERMDGWLDFVDELMYEFMLKKLL